jgi:hypothetical protein
MFVIGLFDHVLELIFEARKPISIHDFRAHVVYSFTVNFMCRGEERCIQGFGGET